MHCSDVPVPRHCQKIPCLPCRRVKYIYFLKGTNQLLQSFPADLTQKKMYLKCQFKNASEASFPDWQKETCYWQHYRNKIPAETHQSVPIPWSGKQIMQKRLCNLMQVHPWAKLVTGLGNINKVHLNQTTSHPLHLKSASGIWMGFGTGVTGSHVPWSWQNPSCEGVLRSVTTTSGTHHFTACISVLLSYKDKPWNINALNL